MKSRQKITERINLYNIHKKAGLRRALAGFLSFAGGWALPWMLHRAESLGYTNSIASVFVFLFLFTVTDKALSRNFEGRQVNWRGWIWPGLFGTAFSLCMVFGTQLDLWGSVPFTDGRMWAGIGILAVLFSILARFFWNEFDRVRTGYGGRSAQGGEQKEPVREKKSRNIFWIRAGVIALCYVPVFLAVYPGFFVYDAQDELLQVVTRNFSTHHPLLHVLALGGIIQLVHKVTGSYNLGIACYTALQMAGIACIFAWGIGKMEKRGTAKWMRCGITLYFGLCPVLVMFSLCSAKDGLFTGMLFMAVILLQELCADADAFFRKKSNALLLGAACVGMMLLRHNGFYGFVVFTPVLALYLRREWRRVIPCLALILACYGLINGGLTKILHADNSENQEMLTVPISQMARISAYEDVPLAEQEILFQYLPGEAVQRYTPKVTDSVKISFDNEAYEADRKGFWSLWAKWGAKHPFGYLNAWFMTSYGFWYPDTVIDTYRGNTVFTYTYEDSSYFGYEVEEPGVRESKIPWLDELYRKMSLEIAQQRIPVVSMLFSPGFLFWVWAFCLGYLCCFKRWRTLLPFMLPALCWCTVLLGPACLVRYVVFLWALLPAVLLACIGKI